MLLQKAASTSSRGRGRPKKVKVCTDLTDDDDDCNKLWHYMRPEYHSVVCGGYSSEAQLYHKEGNTIRPISKPR